MSCQHLFGLMNIWKCVAEPYMILSIATQLDKLKDKLTTIQLGEWGYVADFQQKIKEVKFTLTGIKEESISTWWNKFQTPFQLATKGFSCNLMRTWSCLHLLKFNPQLRWMETLQTTNCWQMCEPLYEELCQVRGGSKSAWSM